MVLPKPESACLLIADISGYTGYLAGVELDHAQDILADLIDTIVGALRPPFQLSKLEGDAAFVYLVAPTVDGLLLQDIVDAAYFKFKRRQRDITQVSICECDACHHIPTLDLKFVVHHGQIARQEMSGHEELVGRDVILIHRLLKNDASGKLSGHAYALFTDAFIKAGGIDPVAQGLVAHNETFDVIGEVKCWLRDLSTAWNEEDERRRVRVTAEDSYYTFTHDFAAPKQILWDYITSPRLRAGWSAGTTEAFELSENGRRGTGTVIHCLHGKDAIVEEILDWHPPEYVTRRYQVPDPRAPPFVSTYELIDLPDGQTRLATHMQKPPSGQEAGFDVLRAVLVEYYDQSKVNLIKLVESEARKERDAETAQPSLPASRGRFLTEPVRAGA
jgi:hypothetical protein